VPLKEKKLKSGDQYLRTTRRLGQEAWEQNSWIYLDRQVEEEETLCSDTRHIFYNSNEYQLPQESKQIKLTSKI